MPPCGLSASESASASAWERRSHRLSKFLDCFADDRRGLRRSDDLRRKNLKLALAFEPRAKLRVLALKSLDSFEQIAGSGIWRASIAAIE